MPKSKKNKNKGKLNLTVREEQRNKLEQMASLEKRSVSNLIEVMADERWERLVEQQGIAYAQTIAGALNLKPDAATAKATAPAIIHFLLLRFRAACLNLPGICALPTSP